MAARWALGFWISIRYPQKLMIYFLIVVTVGGTSSITGPFSASSLLGIGDMTAVNIHVLTSIVVMDTIMIVILISRPQELFARAASR